MAVGQQSSICIYDERDYVTNAKRLENNTIEETMKLQHQTGAAMAPNILELVNHQAVFQKTMRENSRLEKLESLLDYNSSIVITLLNIYDKRKFLFFNMQGEV